jgi:phospho-N-acetylmuramoyl-pentapeptide-transferase
VFIAITNSVNLTDGLDSLAGGTSFVYLLMLVLIIFGQNLKNIGIFDITNYEKLISLSCCLIGGILGFLIFNVNKAKVFMGDTGSLSLGGFLGCVSIFSGNTLIIPFLGIMFVFSAVSVIIQVLVYRKTKKRVFLMAPFHHHLQMKGLTETQVSFVYALSTGIIGGLLVICYL